MALSLSPLDPLTSSISTLCLFLFQFPVRLNEPIWKPIFFYYKILLCLIMIAWAYCLSRLLQSKLISWWNFLSWLDWQTHTVTNSIATFWNHLLSSLSWSDHWTVIPQRFHSQWLEHGDYHNFLVTSHHITWLQRSPLSRSSSHSHLSPPPQSSPATASCSCRGPRPLLALQNCQLPNQRHRWTRFHCRHSIVNIIIVIIFTGMSVCLCHCRYDHCFCYSHHRQERGADT